MLKAAGGWSLPAGTPNSLPSADDDASRDLSKGEFKGEGEDRSTDGIMKQLNLQSIQGVKQHRARPQNLQWCGTHLDYRGAPMKCCRRQFTPGVLHGKCALQCTKRNFSKDSRLAALEYVAYIRTSTAHFS